MNQFSEFLQQLCPKIVWGLWDWDQFTGWCFGCDEVLEDFQKSEN